MLTILLSLAIAGQTNVDVYVASNVNPQEYKALVKARVPVYYSNDDTVLILNPKNISEIKNLELVAQGIPKESLFIYIITNSKDRPQNLPINIDFKVLYQTKHFKLLKADTNKLNEIKKYPLLRPLPLKPIIAQDEQQPAFPPPTGDPIIHRIVDRLTPEMVFDYMRELCGFGTRYTFARNFGDVQNYVIGEFSSEKLHLNNQTYSIQPVTWYNEYALKDNNELATAYYMFKNDGGLWDVYLPRMQGDGCEYNADGSHLQLSAGNYICWNTNPDKYHDWTFRVVGYDYDFPDIMYEFADFYKDGSNIWACGTERFFDTFHNVIFHSTDDGETWDKTNIPQDEDFKTINRFPIGDGSAERFFCAGFNPRIYYSDDGLNWDYFTPPMPAEASINDLCGYPVLDTAGGLAQNYVLCVGRFGTRLITTDGGLTWLWIDDGRYSYEFFKCGYTQGRVWVVGTGGTGESAVLYSDDYGFTWSEKAAPPGALFTLWLNPNDKNDVWVGGTITAHTTDGGETWQTYPDPVIGSNTAVNIVGEKLGLTKPNELVIICAHLDSVSEDPMYDAEGADDDASGCAAVMACAKIMSEVATERTVQFVLFSGNEQFWYSEPPGSQAYANLLAASGKQVVAIMDLDCIGYSDTGVSDIYISNWAEGEPLYNLMVECRDEYVPTLPVINNYDMGYFDNPDCNPFFEKDFTISLIIEYTAVGFNPNVNWKSDRMSNINHEQVFLTTQLVLATALELAGCKRTLQPESEDYFHVYPNPLRPSQGQNVVTFVGLHPGDRVTIYDTMGMKIWTATSDGTLVRWAPQVASGIYLYKVNSSSGNHSGKIAIIK